MAGAKSTRSRVPARPALYVPARPGTPAAAVRALRAVRALSFGRATPEHIAAVAAAALKYWQCADDDGKELYAKLAKRKRPAKVLAGPVPPPLDVIAAVAAAAAAHREEYEAHPAAFEVPGPGTPAPLPDVDMVAADMALKLGYRPSGPLDKLDDIIEKERLRLIDADSLLACLVVSLRADELTCDDDEANRLTAGSLSRVAVFVRQLLKQTLNNLDPPRFPLYAMRRDALKASGSPPPQTSDTDA